MIKSYYPCPEEYTSPETEMKKHRNERNFWKDLFVAVRQPLACLMVAAMAIALCALLSSCTTPKIIEEHHHHTEALDTAAVHAIIDGQMTSWQQRTDSIMRQTMQQYTSEHSSQEQSHETITETVTSWVDSLGREIRQERRTTERDLSRQEQQREERLIQEFETRLQTAMAQQDSQWQQKIDAIKKHYEQNDSSAYNQTPAQKDNRSFWEKLKDTLALLFCGAVIGVAVIVVLFFIKRKS